MRLASWIAAAATAFVTVSVAIVVVQAYFGPFPYPSPFVTLDVMRFPKSIDGEAEKRIASVLSDRLIGMTTEQRFDYLRSYGYSCGVADYRS